MIGTYASAALICAASLLVGRALLSLAGRRAWSWLEPAVGFGAIAHRHRPAGAGARPRHQRHARRGRAGRRRRAGVVCRGAATTPPGALRARAAGGDRRRPRARDPVRGQRSLGPARRRLQQRPRPAPRLGGVAAQRLRPDARPRLPARPARARGRDRGGAGDRPRPGLPRRDLRDRRAHRADRARRARASCGPARRTLAAALVALPYLAASYFAQAAFKETAEALFVLAFAVCLPRPGPALPTRRAARGCASPCRLWRWPAASSSPTASPASPGRSRSLALWSLTLPAVRRALRPRALLRFLLRPLTLLAIARPRRARRAAPSSGPSASPAASTRSPAATPTGRSRRSRRSASGRPRTTASTRPAAPRCRAWPARSAVLALLVGVAWWVRRRELDGADRARRLRRPLPRLAALQRRLLAGQGADDRRAAGDAGRDPAAAGRARPERRVAARGTPARWAPGAARLGGAGRASSSAAPSTRASWSCATRRSAPAGHGAELQAFLPIVHGEPVLYAGQDRYAAYELLGADTHVPLVEFPDEAVSPNPEKPFDTGDAYSPIDFDSFSRDTLERFPYVITGRAAWNSKAPPNFKRIAATPSYVLWERTGETPEDRHVLLEGTEAGAFADCASPEIRDPARQPRPRLALPRRGDRAESAPGAEGSVLGTGDRDLADAGPAGRPWNLSLQYFSPFDLTLSAPGFREPLHGGARRPAPEHDQPRQQRPVLARRPLRERRRQDRVHARSRRGRAACRA